MRSGRHEPVTDRAITHRASGSAPVGPSPEYLALLRGETTAREYVDSIQRQYGYDGEETLANLKAVSAHARWWFLRGCLIGCGVGFLVGLAVSR